MKKIQCFWLSVASLSGGVLTPAVFAEQTLSIDEAPWQRVDISEISSSDQSILSIPQLSDFKFPETRAQLLVQSPILTSIPTPKKHQIQMKPVEINPEVEPIQITVTADRITRPRSTPVYTITAPDIQEQGSNSVAEVLRGLPGFAINDVGPGADIHTGTYYRGASINQSVFLLNGRPIGSNISTYHGATDLNSLPTNAIDRVELSSGTSSTLYGSEAFGGVVNIITKAGQGIPQFNSSIEFGSLDEEKYYAGYSGSIDSLDFNLSYEEYAIDNRYKVPEGAANRDEEGRLFNGDTATSNYFGSLRYAINARNTISLDAYKISSRRGLLYFGFPLQQDRLDHDVLNIGLSWNSLLGNDEDSILKTTLSYNQDYFSTYGPTQSVYYRQGILNSQAINGRVEHQWQTSRNHNLRWGFDLQQSFLNGDVLSSIPERTNLNETEYQDRFHAALFALNTWEISDTFQAELGVRQNFNSEFGNSLNPSVGIQWIAGKNMALRGSWVSVQRNPGLDQLYVYDTVHNWLPNPDLDPETGSSWTAGIDLYLTPTLKTQFTYFGSHLNHRLGILNGRWENIGLVNTHGFEAALRWQITPAWSTFLNYTYTDAQIASGAEKGLQLGLVPYSVAQLGIGYSRAGWQVNLFATYNSGSRRAFFNNSDDKNTDFSPSYLNLDLSARIPITDQWGLNIYLENLADRVYEKVNRIYHPGLTFRIGLESRF